MKHLTLFIVFVFIVFNEIQAQDIFSSTPINDVQTVTEGIYPETNTISLGGQEKTASGVLRVLVIFVRYLDDTENTTTWPDYTVLPTWAQTFVDPETPSNNIYTAKNMSDFFDRCSGGNGSGTLGSFKMIGDVVYVTTLHNQTYYNNDTEVFTEVLQTLDNPSGAYNINFKLYDNWEFMKDNILYRHEYKPGIGDGKVDHIFIINRQGTRSGHLWAEKTLENINFTSNDGVVVSRYCGSRIFGFKDSYTPRAVGGPAHEYCHYLLGGNQVTGHFDGSNYFPWQTGNQGRINQFALMCAVNAGWMSAYERYRLGWLTPYVVNSNISAKVLKDTHIKNEAILIPLRDPYKNSWREFYLIENYHTQRDYANANPFLKDEVFGDPITRGLLVFHIEEQNYTLPCATKINILCADGKWTWKLLTGASTPYDRSDDLIGRDQPARFGNYDERNFITITVPPVTYNDYVCLDHHPDFPGSKYDRNDFLGDFADFFGVGYNDVLTKYSNPGTYIIGGIAKDVGFEITGYNATTKEYTLSLQVTAAGVTSLKPSKPQNLKVTASTTNHPELTWEANIEPDKSYYKVFKYSNSEFGWQFLGIAATPYYQDVSVSYCTPGQYCPEHTIKYRVTCIDIQSKESVPSDSVMTSVRGFAEQKIISNSSIENLPSEYSLSANYPNPFNPTTIINYAVKDAGLVSIKVYDILGKEVAILVNETKEAGNYEVDFNAANCQAEFIFTLCRSMVLHQVKKCC